MLLMHYEQTYDCCLLVVRTVGLIRFRTDCVRLILWVRLPLPLLRIASLPKFDEATIKSAMHSKFTASLTTMYAPALCTHRPSYGLHL